VPSLYFRLTAPKPTDPRRDALLEGLLARADEVLPVLDWRADAFRLIAPAELAMPGVGATALFAGYGAVEAAWICMASPVRYAAEMSTIRLPPEGILSLTMPQAEALAADFNRLWQDSGLRLMAGAGGQLFCLFEHAQDLKLRDPEEVLGRYIELYLPGGADSSRARRLMSEIEMWLFEHAVNEERAAQGLPVINALWLWGGGPALATLPTLLGWSKGDDVFFRCFKPGASASGVIVVRESPASDTWSQLPMQWLKSALEQLRSGAITDLSLSGADRCFTVTALGSRRFWRRRKPWWEFFE
jgi:hypothetical protein